MKIRLFETDLLVQLKKKLVLYGVLALNWDLI